jgi:hypothetical protein
VPPAPLDTVAYKSPEKLVNRHNSKQQKNTKGNKKTTQKTHKNNVTAPGLS